jgi:hypothetical protein
LAPVTLTVAAGNTNFTGPVSSFVTSGSGTFQQANGSTITLNWYDDPANGQGATTPTTTPGMLVDTFSHTAVGTADSFRHDGGGSVNDPALFSMTDQVTGTLVAGGQLINRGQTEIKDPTVPEPTSLATLGASLAGMGMIDRERQKA